MAWKRTQVSLFETMTQVTDHHLLAEAEEALADKLGGGVLQTQESGLAGFVSDFCTRNKHVTIIELISRRRCLVPLTRVPSMVYEELANLAWACSMSTSTSSGPTALLCSFGPCVCSRGEYLTRLVKISRPNGQAFRFVRHKDQHKRRGLLAPRET